MKKKLRWLLPLLLLVCAVILLRQNKGPQMTWMYIEEEAPALEGVSFQLEGHYTKKAKNIVYTITNQSQEEISGGEPGGFYYVRAEQWTEDGWRYWTIDPNQEFPEDVVYAPAAVGFGLMPGSTSQEFSLPFKEILPEVTPGRYRLAWDFKAGNPDEGWNNYTVYQEFTIEP